MNKLVMVVEKRQGCAKRRGRRNRRNQWIKGGFTDIFV
jgi:hypothetical protein